MRVAIFGGTGGVGRWLIAIARENGDHVKLLVRDRRKLPKDLGVIGVIEGDVRDQEAVDATIGGCDVVFSALGAGGGGGATDVYSVGFRNIITAMHKADATRLIAVTSAGVDDDPNMSFLARRVVLPLMLGRVLADMKLGELEIERSNLVYTIVRPMRLTDGPRSGLYRGDDHFIPEHGKEISRADVADFMNRIVIDERTLRKTIAIAY